MVTAKQKAHRARFTKSAKSGTGKIGKKAAAPTNFKKKISKKTVRKVTPATTKAALVARLRKAKRRASKRG